MVPSRIRRGLLVGIPCSLLFVFVDIISIDPAYFQYPARTWSSFCLAYSAFFLVFSFSSPVLSASFDMNNCLFPRCPPFALPSLRARTIGITAGKSVARSLIVPDLPAPVLNIFQKPLPRQQERLYYVILRPPRSVVSLAGIKDQNYLLCLPAIHIIDRPAYDRARQKA